MTLRRVVFPGILAISLGLGFSSACSAPDPGLVIFSTNPAKLKADSGIVTVTDGGGGDSGPAPPASVFDGEPAYISTSGSSTDEQGHANHFGGDQNPAGHDCLSCHLPDATTPFTFAGTIFPPDSGSDAGANNVQVLIKNADGTTLSTYTNAEGNFFFLASVTGTIEPNAMVGARNATAVQDMPDHLTGPTQGGCNQGGTCHGGTEGQIHVP